MKKIRLLSLFLLIALLASVGSTAAANNRNFRAHLSGDEEVPPVDTNAQGQAIFKLNKAGDELHFKLIVANIEDVTQAHIHLAPAGQNGGVVAFLYPGPTTTTNGVLAEGAITAANLVGPIAGDFAALITAMEAGDTYVNVHTSANPGGEIRGQIH